MASRGSFGFVGSIGDSRRDDTICFLSFGDAIFLRLVRFLSSPTASQAHHLENERKSSGALPSPHKVGPNTRDSQTKLRLSLKLRLLGANDMYFNGRTFDHEMLSPKLANRRAPGSGLARQRCRMGTFSGIAHRRVRC